MSSNSNNRGLFSCLLVFLAGSLLVTVCIIGFVVLSLTGMIVIGNQVIQSVEATETALAGRPFVDVSTPNPPTLPPLSDVSTPTPPTTLGDDGLAAPAPATATPTMAPTAVTFNLPVPVAIDQRPVPAGAAADQAQLYALDFPPRDYHAVSGRLDSRAPGPRTITSPLYDIGDTQTFITDQGRATAVLMARTEHAYFWVDTDASISDNTVIAAAERFENQYYPRLVALFGAPWEPGVDNDPRISILHLASFAGDHLGFFDQADEYPQSVAPASNQQEIFYLNLNQLTVGEDLYYGTLVHEFEHLIQWYVDGNEPIWMDEGLAQLAEIYLGYETAETIDYLVAPETQLNSWSYDDDNAIFAHYAAGYLFTTYFWEQLGDGAVQELSRHPANGLQGVAAVLPGYRPETDLISFFGDWAVANWLDDPSIDSRYGYDSLRLSQPDIWDTMRNRSYDAVHDLNQFGVHYVKINVDEPATLSFAGDTVAELIDAPPHSGERMWLAVGVDNLDAQLTATVDLTGLNQATLNFWAWYDLEEEIDMAYVTVSADGGATWNLLLPDHRAPGEFGPGFSGRSRDEADDVDGWVQESLSLNQYAGQSILIRFNVLTDFGLTSRGFAVDDIAIPELGYFSDVEGGADGWEAFGFVQSGSLLPQQWQLQLIDEATGRVVVLPLSGNNQGQWSIDLGRSGGVLVITPVTQFIYEPATYWLNLS